MLEKVPVNTPTEWLHRMVLAAKHDGSPRRTVDLGPLNDVSYRQTHHTPSPWQCAAAVPRNTFKTKLDAWNAYHSVDLTPESQKLVIFSTMRGTYTYRKAGWYFPREPMNFVCRKFSKSQEILKNMHQISEELNEHCV